MKVPPVALKVKQAGEVRCWRGVRTERKLEKASETLQILGGTGGE